MMAISTQTTSAHIVSEGTWFSQKNTDTCHNSAQNISSTKFFTYVSYGMYIYLHTCNSVYLILALIGVRTFFWRRSIGPTQEDIQRFEARFVDLGAYFPPDDLSNCIFFEAIAIDQFEQWCIKIDICFSFIDLQQSNSTRKLFICCHPPTQQYKNIFFCQDMNTSQNPKTEHAISFGIVCSNNEHSS